jgi:hypothetical protein
MKGKGREEEVATAWHMNAEASGERHDQLYVL